MYIYVRVCVCARTLRCFSHVSADKESACNAGDLGSFLGLGRSPGEANGYPLQYSGLENSMDCIVHGVTIVGHDLATFNELCNFHLKG